MDSSVLEGGPFERGWALGKATRRAIRFNVNEFWSLSEAQGLGRNLVLSKYGVDIEGVDAKEYLKGLSLASSIPLADIIAYNVVKPKLSPDECTVMIAMGDSTSTGMTTMLKNSDHVGSERQVGRNFYQNKDIHVVIAEKPDNGNRFVAVAAAGQISIKMGMNDKGVAAASNISRTTELRQKKMEASGLKAVDRGRLLREGIVRASTSQQASEFVSSQLIESPMSTPGNIEFVDHGAAFIIEGSYDRLAVQKVSSGVVARTNGFALLHDLNDPKDRSSQARLIRANQLLQRSKGKIGADKMIEFSQDHLNGPGLNSICRHDSDFRSETSLAAAVMEINGSSPAKSKFYAALGKPCRAWPSAEGHVTVSLEDAPGGIPAGFLDGDVWKEFYGEAPKSRSRTAP